MTKRDLIAAIMQYNLSANPAHLVRFSETELRRYLDRVMAVCPQQPAYMVRLRPGHAA
jgi:hypothetical protein